MADPGTPLRLIIVSGLSGSGKSIAIHTLEDLGFYCVDNLPLGLLPQFAIEARNSKMRQNYAIGIDARNLSPSLSDFPDLLESLRQQQIECEVVFLDADDNTLIKRYSETRRRHPLGGRELPLAEAIGEERLRLDAIASCSHLRIDTSRTNIHQLRALVGKLIEDGSDQLTLLFESFGYKYGIPVDADFVFDLRCLPNPYWEPRLRELAGTDGAVGNYLEGHPQAIRMYNDLHAFLDYWIAHFAADNRRYLTVAFGCTGGQHRSVWMVERIAAAFHHSYRKVLTRHREIT